MTFWCHGIADFLLKTKNKNKIKCCENNADNASKIAAVTPHSHWAGLTSCHHCVCVVLKNTRVQRSENGGVRVCVWDDVRGLTGWYKCTELAERFSELEGSRVTMQEKERQERERIKRIEGGTGKNEGTGVFLWWCCCCDRWEPFHHLVSSNRALGGLVVITFASGH